MAESAGLYLDEWQRNVLRDALAQRVDGKWAAREVALIVPRQNGKGSVLEALELAALFLPEPGGPPPLVLHSAHEFKTADEHFRRMRDLIEGTDQFRKQIRIVRTASGSQAIELVSGARLRFVTRSNGSGRGFSAQLVVMDEAYNLSDDSMAAVLPTLSAQVNPQIWYTSSAGMASSTVLDRVRTRGHKGGDRQLAYFEWAAPKGADLDDERAWRQANPALGIRIDLDAVAGERAAMSDEQFGRERLGLWADADAFKRAIDPAVWSSLSDPAAPRGKDVVFVLDVAADQSTASVAVAWRRPDGGTQVQLADHRPGTSWVPAKLRDLTASGGRVLLLKAGTAAFLLPDLEGVPTETVERQFFVDACGTLNAAVLAGTVRHGNQQPVTEAVAASRWSPTGEAGVRVLSRKDPAVSPLIAVGMAVHAVASLAEAPSAYEARGLLTF